jgi:hypothetical protein
VRNDAGEPAGAVAEAEDIREHRDRQAELCVAAADPGRAVVRLERSVGGAVRCAALRQRR